MNPIMLARLAPLVLEARSMFSTQTVSTSKLDKLLRNVATVVLNPDEHPEILKKLAEDVPLPAVVTSVLQSEAAMAEVGKLSLPRQQSVEQTSEDRATLNVALKCPHCSKLFSV